MASLVDPQPSADGAASSSPPPRTALAPASRRRLARAYRPRRGWVEPQPQWWDAPDMRAALAARDIGAVMGLLQERHLMSQRAIAAGTGQSQSEISEIITGGRQVISVELLQRIATGLGIPPGYLGLAAPPAGPATTLLTGATARARPRRTAALASRWWNDPTTAAALAAHDFATVFTHLRRAGISDSDIAAGTGLTPADVDAVAAGLRTVDSYAALVAMCDWLGIPRGHVGLAFVRPAPPVRPDGRPLLPERWTGAHIRALRQATRLTVRALAGLLGVTDRTVTSWECHGTTTVPRPRQQELLDAMLTRLDHHGRAVYLYLVDRPHPQVHHNAAVGTTSGPDPGTAPSPSPSAEPAEAPRPTGARQATLPPDRP